MLRKMWRFILGVIRYIMLSITKACAALDYRHYWSYGVQGVEDVNNDPAGTAWPASWVDKVGNLWLFGGYHYHSGFNAFNALWKYNITTGNWTWMKGSNVPNSWWVLGTQGVEDSNNTPGALKGMASSVDESGHFWLFGGSLGGSVTLNDLWKYIP